MSKFNKGEKRGMPELNTSSLPDLVFSILFFFMCVTHMREDTPIVKVNTPRADQVTKLENKSLVTTVLIGKPRDTRRGSEDLIQFNDDFLDMKNVQATMEAARESMKEADRPKMQILQDGYRYRTQAGTS